MTIRTLTTTDLSKLVEITSKAAETRGAEFFAWKNSPEVDVLGENWENWTHKTGWGDSAESKKINGGEAAKIFKAKLDGAYAERLIMALGYAIGAVQAGVEVCFLQILEEETPRFDPEGWLVLSINRHPFFHISPEDLPTGVLEDQGWVNVISKDSDIGKDYEWKPEIGEEGKPKEFGLLLSWLLSPPSSPGSIS